MSEKIELSSEQQQAVLDFWNKNPSEPPNIKDIITHVFGEGFDGRTAEGKAVMAFLASRNLAFETKSKYKPIQIELSEAHKDYIKNNAGTMGPVDMARIIFSNPALSNLNAETRAVNEYLKSLGDTVTIAADLGEVPAGDYKPPQTVFKCVQKVNNHINGRLNPNNLSAREKKGIESLINYLHNKRVIRQINQYNNESDRASFEDAFIRYTYNKPELSEEEVDQYCVLANEVVIGFKAQRRSERLQEMLEEVTQTDPESAKIAMSLVEAIGKATTELNLCVSRQQKLLDDLTEKRSDKLSKQIKDNASVLNIFRAWKEEETRKEWLKLAEIEEKALDKEVEKITSMDEIKSKVLGLTKAEALYG